MQSLKTNSVAAAWGLFACGLFALLTVEQAAAGDWPRFRGPDGSGISPDAKPAPIEWSDVQNLKWKLPLPGPGSSSPIVVGDHVFVTAWSGYGVERGGGEQKDIKRHLLCVGRGSGKVLWDRAVDAVLPEESYRGQFAEHGYASHTPTSDGEHVYAFFGKTGVLAFDLDGKQLWQVSVGTDDDSRSWGTASSPILYKNLVIVPATIESQSLVALDKRDGHEVWRKKAEGFASTWGTPLLVGLKDARQELVMGVPNEAWAFDPAKGTLLWYCQTSEENSMCSSLVAHDGVVYGVEGRSGGSFAIRAGGEGDVTASHRLWQGRDRGRISTPLYFDGCLYWVSSGIINCIDAANDQPIYRKRLAAGGADVVENAEERRGPGGPRGRGALGGRGGPDGRGGGRDRQRGRGGPGGRGEPGGRGGSGGGGGRGQDYSSPIIVGNSLYYVSRAGAMYVVSLGRDFKLLATNHFPSDTSGYSATPAASDGELFIRSNANLYCVGESKAGK